MYRFFIFLFCFYVECVFAQDEILPQEFSQLEIGLMDEYLSNYVVSSEILLDPPEFNVRTMAEWEEIQALTIAWEGFPSILTEIVRNSVDQC